MTSRILRGELIHRTGKPVDTTEAERAGTRLLRRRLIQDGERTYRAYSADELIELDNLAHHGRPGHLHG